MKNKVHDLSPLNLRLFGATSQIRRHKRKITYRADVPAKKKNN
jgi:hypothetical protein